MPLDKAQAEELKSLVAVARKRPLNFGLCVGKQPEGTILELHRVKSPEILGRLAKKSGETAKIAFGTLEVKGKRMTLNCAEDPPPGLAKRTKMFLKSLDMKMAVIIADAEGNILEQEIDEEDLVEDERDEEEAAEEGAPAAPDWPALTAELSRLAKTIAETAGSDAAWRQSLVALAGRANAALKARQDFAATRAAIDALGDALAVAPAGTAPAAAAMPVWTAAKDVADTQLRGLSDRLRKSGTPELVEVAAEVETLLEPVRAKLVAALLDYDRAPARPETRAAALSAVAAAGTWLGADARVRAVDNNPWGVPVSVAATLGAALLRLQRELAAAGRMAS
jgi:hypothetical protein